MYIFDDGKQSHIVDRVMVDATGEDRAQCMLICTYDIADACGSVITSIVMGIWASMEG